jgi:hypothetical protein
MEKLSVKTRKAANQPQYKEKLNSVVTFLKHSEDRIECKNGELVNIDIYENGNLIFSGDKGDLFDLLKVAQAKQ